MKNKPQHIIWFSAHPNSYNDFLFSRLGDQDGVCLEVVYRQRVLSSHPWQSPLGEGQNLRYYKPVFGVDVKSLAVAFKYPNSLVVVAGWDHLTTFVLLTLLRLLRRDYAIWTDTPNLRKARPIFKRLPRAVWLQWIFHGALKIMVTGSAGVQDMIAIGAPPQNTTSLPFFLDLDGYKRAPDVQTGDTLRFMSSGRLLNEVKGHHIAIRALAIAMEEYKGKWEYVIAGTGRDAAVLKALARELGLKDRVVFAGWLEPDQLVNLYHSSDIVLHPSPIHDPFPNAVLEGMAASCVVMASDLCGSAIDRIENDRSGYIHPAGEYLQLARQIKNVVLDPIKMRDVALNARAVAEQWPVERGVKTILSIVQS
ncbi:glycosyltransferase [Rhodobacterales bacterium FZCC0069]|nr:glycosyltransferase [Rhodobacterales bacterium FZCC0069]